MTLSELLKQDFSPEFQFQASRSGGAGGQNVNKVSTKMELRFNVTNSQLLDDEQKRLFHEKLKNQINSEGELIIVSQEERTQLRNKNIVIKKFRELLIKALTIPKKRVKVTPTAAMIAERLKDKKKASEKKAHRGKIDY
ncbi:alternative ribosome rescue aminoacyl-tRNA hydrolase ArfB [Arcicella sp. LKC2W]|uniref:alternative ribosome rescue aminoacyl-tRNA hydrolase ArfB n=1 Tax=Arcicella sp. LKC2W TaxID=2984198 RepID=UPI002B213141|nr:alternative ribosome rescue aminoacyl-tRNA hydrolase ArfB [Arcicella sp. LKC2W]MEA5458952.1 alternative ribosome rescue aminoacyl-tRNA hydrolase ArfB [Arcicella sp. LKC2W]